MFAGLISHKPAKKPSSWVSTKNWQKALYPLIEPDLTGEFCDDRFRVVESDRYNTPWSKCLSSVPLVEDDIVCAFWGRIDNRQEIEEQLGLAKPVGELSDTELLCAAWSKWGEAVPNHLYGDFSLAIYDKAAKSLFIARDRLGIRPFYYWAHKDAFFFATTPVALKCLKGLKPTPSKRWIAQYLMRVSMHQTTTAYEEISKLEAGHWAKISADGEIEIKKYHAWKDDAPAVFERDPRNVAKYRSVLDRVFKDTSVTDYKLGLENSGGVDSATVISFIVKELGEPGDRMRSYGFAMAEEEPGYILEVSQANKIQHNYIVTHRTRDGMRRQKLAKLSLEILGYPEEHGNGSGHQDFYDLCKARDIRTLYSGFGGDEVVTNYALQLQKEMLDNKQYRRFFEMVPGKGIKQFLRGLKWIWVDKRSEEPEFNPKFVPGARGRLKYSALSDSALKDHAIPAQVMDSARYDAGYRSNNDWVINGQLKMGFIPTRFENCTLMAAAAGIEYRWPLWDARLVQCFLSIPAVERMGRGAVGRYLHRRAISGVVPHRVAWKQGKYMGPVLAANNDREKSDSELIALMEQLRDNLHPILQDLISVDRINENIDAMKRGEISSAAEFPVARFYFYLESLNMWLYGDDV